MLCPSKPAGEGSHNTEKRTARAAGLQFMVKTGVDKFSPEDRTLIRSHVMKGKNLGKIRPPRRRRALNKTDLPQDILSPCSNSTDAPGHCDVSPLVRVSPPAIPNSKYYHSIRSPTTVPRKFGSTASAVSFADSVEPALVDVILRFSSIAKQLLFPLERCIFFDKRAENWIAPLAVDPAYLHANIFTSLYYFDVILPRRSSHANEHALYHQHKALSMLRERLLCGNDRARLSNITVSVVLSLTSYAFWTGDFKSVKHHLEGIRKMVNLRGGLSTLRDNEKLLLEILRCDLGAAVHSGAKPIFFKSASSSEPRLPYPDLTLFLETRKPDLTTKGSRLADSATCVQDVEIDGELASAWMVLSDFCSVINFAAASEKRITVGIFLDTMASVMYRLLDMHFEIASSDEAIHLGLLCFSSSVFLQWQHLGMSYIHLTSRFRDCFVRLTTAPSHISPRLVLWLLMVGAASVLDGSDDVWLKPLLRETMAFCEVGSWRELRDLLMSFMWIGLANDRTGKRVYDTAVG